MTRLDVERTELRSFTCGVHFEATRNLALLGAIESTLSWLESLTTRLLADTNFADKANEGLASFADVIDPDGTIQNALESAQSDVDELYQLLVEKRQHGRNDTHLTEDDGIEGAYSEAIAQAADLHNSINTLRWNIGEHDIDASPKTNDPSLVGSTPNEIEAIFKKLISE